MNLKSIIPLTALVLLLASCAKTEPAPEPTPGGQQTSQRDDNTYGEHPTWTNDSTNSFWSKSSSIIQNTNID